MQWQLQNSTGALQDNLAALGQEIADINRSVADLDGLFKWYYDRPLEAVAPELYLIPVVGGGLMVSGAQATIRTIAGTGAAAGLKIVTTGAGVGGGANLATQYLLAGEQPIDWGSVILSGATGGLGAPAKSIWPVLQLNTGAALFYSGLNGQNPAGPVAGAVLGTVIGYGIGSVVGTTANHLGNTVRTGARGNYQNNWTSPFGYTSTSYHSGWHTVAPYWGVASGNAGTEIGGAITQDWLKAGEKR
jgi:hypothetical protein